ncbi:hypothetical protein PVW48_10690 [Dinoroseobacter sp. PD6]|uniref:hypothetical protein n=1 Tax=Dinoroseobacter sp. PD6 TaxID=3028384 RepID=UPI00237AE2D2|nr:hypothetical protein [Dinoroseobacter sp. PD6]MDD9717214.1 hypothetical protein [Dinoroseobacter sp. PD6]
MSRVAVCAMVAALCAAPAIASVSEIDTDGDNLASYEEMTPIYPDLTEDLFGEIDTSGDGFVDDAELTAALDAEKLTPAAE